MAVFGRAGKWSQQGDAMRLTMQTDDALRMLIQLGVHNDRPVTVEETARTYQVC
jgi:hypothetical protein